MDPLAHILHRPDTYVGSTRSRELDEYISIADKNFQIYKKSIVYCPAILRIFIEPLSNAIDNVSRSQNTKTPCTTIKVKVDIKSGSTSVWNDGECISVEYDDDNKCYNHSLIFGQLLTSSNYDDDEDRYNISGRNGIGIKTCLKQGTLVPDFFGNILKVEDIPVGHKLIGDDGTPRIVTNKVTGISRLFEVSQQRGNSYIVNEEHILCVRMPDHKVIFWNTSKNGWSVLYLNKEDKKVHMKSISVSHPEIICPECKKSLSGNLNRHYKRIHKDKPLPELTRLSPTIIPPETEEVKQSLLKIKEFSDTIQDDNTLDISIKDYIKLPKTTKGRLSGYLGECVQWNEQKVDLDPYVLGLWLGDGSQGGHRFAINAKDDPEILEYLQKWGETNDATFKCNQNFPISWSISSTSKCRVAPMKKLLLKYNLINNKHIPQEYIVNSRQVRLSVLAGFIDSDGHVSSDGRRITIAQGMDHSKLASDLIFLVKSLGFMCSSHISKTQWKYKGELRRGNAVNINISGKGVEDIPTLVNRKRCLPPLSREVTNTGKLIIKEVTTGEYVGLSVDCNKRFVLEDFTVTHNCNVFSEYFSVHGIDPVNKKSFFQEWTDNMKKINEPEIGPTKLKKGSTEVSWIPDFKQFNMTGYTEDIINLYCRYVVDAAMLTNVNVYFNDVLIPVKNLKDYSSLYSTVEEKDVLYINTKDSHIVIMPSYSFQFVSFVNGVYTSLGGTHVDAWVEAAFRPLVQKLTKPKSSVTYTIGDVKKFFKIFVVVKVINPEFESQSKHKLESPVIATIKTSDINKMLKWSVMDDIQRSKEIGVLKKLERKKRTFTKIEGLDPANNEGGKLGHQCTLILVEGLAAKTYAVKGIEVGAFGKTGRDFFGIYSLKGKVLNVRNAKASSIANNTVVSDIIKALGAKLDANYTDDQLFMTLRYGRILIITDADCVAHDTPVLTKNKDGMIGVTTIDSLNQTDWINDHSMTDLQVWSNNEWTDVLGIRRKTTTKNMYRIVTHTGIIDVTEDHKLITEHGNEISASDCKIGDKLMHSFPRFYDDITNINLDQLSHKELCHISSKIGIRYYQKKKKYQLVQLISNYIKSPIINITLHPDVPTVDEAYVMGLFWADGTSGIYSCDYKYKPKTRPNEYTFKRVTYSWSISNTNYEFLSKSLNILAKHYDYEFKIIKRGYKKAYKLIVNGGIKTKEFVEKYTKLFYDKNRNKKIPEQILNSSIETRELFFKGYYDGDRKGKEKRGIERFDICGKIGSHCMFLLCKSLGYKVSINNRLDKPNVYTLVLTKEHQQKDPLIIKKIIPLNQTNNYVYDIETANHSFQGGIGQLISHNCDGIHISGLLQNMVHTLFPTLLEREESFITSMQTPIVRVFLPGGKKNELLFYDEREYQKYVVNYNEKNPNKKIDKKYYKGLGSSSDQDIVDTFGVKMVEFKNDENTNFNMNKIFHTKQSDARKVWLENYDIKEVSLVWDGDKKETKSLNMSDFLNTEMIKFSLNDCKRSIPALMDGLKESHRKTLYSCFKKNLRYTGKSLKVAQLAGYVAEHSAYHHGEQNLYDTITKMANSYPGSNNIPLLYRDGQFGCIDPNTPVLMWDFSIKKACDIQVGDKLVGDDGTERNVTAITSGEDEMYEVSRDGMDSYIVNSHHILTLMFSIHKRIFWEESRQRWTMYYINIVNKKVYTKSIGINSKIIKKQVLKDMELYASTINDCNIVDINVQEYLSLPEHIRKHMKGIVNSVSIEKEYQKTSKDPYIIGCWLGEGKEIDLYENNYIENSEDVRLQLIAGFIDSNGILVKQNGTYIFDIFKSIKYKFVINSVNIIAISLGFKTTIKSYDGMVCLSITGDLSRIPIKVQTKKVLSFKLDKDNYSHSIKITNIGKGKFNGWNIDGNERFLLADSTITHNTRLSGGKDAANARYIFTKLDAMTRLLFRPEDDILLDKVVDDGDVVEPIFYVPILPTILINGCIVGIGTGWSSSVPSYNPIDLIQSVKCWLDNDGKVLLKNEGTTISLLPEIIPWYRGFTGLIEKSSDGRYTSWGHISEEKNTKVVDELPIGMWTDNFKEFLDVLQEDKSIKKVKNYSTPKKIRFVITEEADGIVCNKENLKLSKYIYTSNMVLFDENGNIKKYESIDEIIDSFCKIRLEYYIKRKKYILDKLDYEIKFLGNKKRFLEEVMSGDVKLFDDSNKTRKSRKTSALIADLESRGYDKETSRGANQESDENDENDENEIKGGYDYLLRLQFRSITEEKIDKLKNDIKSNIKLRNEMSNTSEKELWIRDLDEFEKEYTKWLKMIEQEVVKTKKK